MSEDFDKLPEDKKKEWFKEALKEWLTEERNNVAQTLGEWVFKAIATAFVVFGVYAMLRQSGWEHK